MRDYSENPMCANEAIVEFYAESFDLVFASEEVIEEASNILENNMQDYAAANDIHARYFDYQEEMNCMMSDLA